MSKFLRPTRVHVGWTTYRIRFLNHKEWMKSVAREQDAGGTWHEAGLILIRTSSVEHGKFCEQAIKETLVHELMHCCAHAGSWASRDLPKRPSNDDMEEQFIHCTSGPLLQLLMDNEAVMEYLLR